MRLALARRGPRAGRGLKPSAGWLGLGWLLALPAGLPIVIVLLHFGSAEPGVLAHLNGQVLPRVLGNTLWLVAGVAIGAGLLGTAAAWLVAVYDFPGRGLFAWALLLPMAVPGYVMAFVAIGLLDYAGPVQSALRAWLGPQAGLPPIRSYGGVVLVMSLVLYPYVYLIARNAFATQGRRALEVGASLGLGAFASFRKVALPLARPWIAGGVLLVAMETLADFGTVSAFNYDTFTTAIYQSWFGLFSLGGAMHLAAMLVAIVALLVLAEQALRGRARYNVGRSPQPLKRLRLRGGAALCACAALSLLLIVAFVLPVAQLAFWAVGELGELSMPRLTEAAGNTVMLAAAAALLIVVLAGLLGFARRMQGGFAMRLSTRLATLGYALPGPVLAVGIFTPLAGLSAWAGAGLNWSLSLQTTLFALLLAYAGRFLTVAHAPVEANLQRITRAMEEASTSLGIGGWRMFGRVHLPLLRGGLAAGATLVFVDVMKEMPITLMMRPYGWDTLAVRIYEFTAEGRWEQAALPAVLLVITGFLPVALLTLRGEK